MPAISIIVPIYNVESYLPRCIDSILSQSFTDFELILVDDGSPDRCGTICDEYAVKDERIRVIHQENARVSAARNAGLDIARGEWIAFVDSDDWIHKDYLRILLSGALDDTEIVVCGYQITSNDEETDSDYVKAVFTSETFDEAYSDHIFQTRSWGRLIRRNAIGGSRYIPGTEPSEDACFNELFFRRNMKIRVTDAKLYYYFMRPNSAVHKPMGRGMLNAVHLLLERLGSIDDAEKRERLVKRCYKYVFSARYSEMFSADYGAIKRKCRVLLKRLAVYLPDLNTRDRLMMCVFSALPIAYRAYRILGDPSLLSYERNCKKVRNELRKQKRNRQTNV